ncbi:MAG: FtsH protease activity modulator HflK [Ancalomicrobiaceae bacterium]|nr:FtsH protease activity modulator HflK [Ancalomicrobiaceae bacterium]
MPWSNQSGGGGGWRGGGGGGPWGSPPRGPGNGQQPPDLEEILKRGQDRLRSLLPGGNGFGAPAVLGILAIAVILWGLTGVYRVEPDEIGVELVLGQVRTKTSPGLHWNFPYPIGDVEKPKVLQVRELTVGLRDADSARGVAQRDVPEESLMLTGDENLVDVDFKVQWSIKDPIAYLFNIQRQEDTVKAVAESAMREAIGKNNIQRILTEAREKIEVDVRDMMQKTLDDYKSGVEVRLVQMQKVDPPADVIDAFRDVQAARADAERVQNQAQANANKVVQDANGQASEITARGQAYMRQTVEEARGQADRYLKVYEQYKKAPDVTRERLYLETMERVFGTMDKTIVDTPAANGLLPLLNLDKSAKPSTTRTGTQP